MPLYLRCGDTAHGVLTVNSNIVGQWACPGTDRQTQIHTHTHTHTHTPQGLGKVRSAAHRGQINSKKQRTNDNQKPNEEHS